MKVKKIVWSKPYEDSVLGFVENEHLYTIEFHKKENTTYILISSLLALTDGNCLHYPNLQAAKDAAYDYLNAFVKRVTTGG